MTRRPEHYSSLLIWNSEGTTFTQWSSSVKYVIRGAKTFSERREEAAGKNWHSPNHFQSLVTRCLLAPTRHIHTDMVASSTALNPRYAIEVEVPYLLIAQKRQQIFGIFSGSLHIYRILFYGKVCTHETSNVRDMLEGGGNTFPQEVGIYVTMTSHKWWVNQYELACFGLPSPWSFPSRSGMFLHALMLPWLSLPRSTSSWKTPPLVWLSYTIPPRPGLRSSTCRGRCRKLWSRPGDTPYGQLKLILALTKDCKAWTEKNLRTIFVLRM